MALSDLRSLRVVRKSSTLSDKLKMLDNLTQFTSLKQLHAEQPCHLRAFSIFLQIQKTIGESTTPIDGPECCCYVVYRATVADLRKDFRRCSRFNKRFIGICFLLKVPDMISNIIPHLLKPTLILVPKV